MMKVEITPERTLPKGKGIYIGNELHFAPGLFVISFGKAKNKSNYCAKAEVPFTEISHVLSDELEKGKYRFLLVDGLHEFKHSFSHEKQAFAEYLIRKAAFFKVRMVFVGSTSDTIIKAAIRESAR